MLSFIPKNNDYIRSIIFADVTLEKIRVGSLEVPGMDPERLRAMSLSFIGQAVADHYGELLEHYGQNAPSWMSVIHEVDAIPYVSMENAGRAAEWHDYVLAEGEIVYNHRVGFAEKIGETFPGKRPVYVVTDFSRIDGPALAYAINHACRVIPGFDPMIPSSRVSMASTLVGALETLNEYHHIGVMLRNPSGDELRMMKAARVRFVNAESRYGEPIAIIGYNTIPDTFVKYDLQAVAKHF